MATKKDIDRLKMELETKIDKLETKLETKIDHIDGAQNRILLKVVQHSEDIKDIREQLKKLALFDTLLAGQDKMIGILTRLDQEFTFSNERFKKLEHRLDAVEARYT